MQIDVKGRNVSVSDEIRDRVTRRFAVVGRQVSELARLELEVTHERNPAIPASMVVEATLFLKGVTLRACERDRDLTHAINLTADDLTRQVKRHRDKRRKRREARAAAPREVRPAA